MRVVTACLSVGLACLGCAPFGDILERNMMKLGQQPRPVHDKITEPVRPEARLAVLWVGHATMLVQIDDKIILTDPVFTSRVGVLSPRLVAPGLDVSALPSIDACLISHMHFDHLSLGTLELIEDKVRRLLVPQGGLVYIPDLDFEAEEVPTWRSFEQDGLRITAVPTKSEWSRPASGQPRSMGSCCG